MAKKDWRPVSEVLEALGMSQDEAVTYLKARGVKVSLGAVKAWGRGHYTTPEDAIEELWKLWLAVWGEDSDDYPMPPEAPESVRARAKTFSDLKEWYEPRDPFAVWHRPGQTDEDE